MRQTGFVGRKALLSKRPPVTCGVVHLAEEAVAQSRRGSVGHAAGPALANGLQQQRLRSGGLNRQLRKLQDALCGERRRSLGPARQGQKTETDTG